MALVRRNYELNNSFFNDFDRFFNSPAKSSAYNLDLYEVSDGFVVEMALPGIKRDAIDISVKDMQLSIKASYPTKQDEGFEYHIKTLPTGDINRVVTLSKHVNIEGISAKVEDGILTIHLPKLAEIQARKVEVN